MGVRAAWNSQNMPPGELLKVPGGTVKQAFKPIEAPINVKGFNVKLPSFPGAKIVAGAAGGAEMARLVGAPPWAGASFGAAAPFVLGVPETVGNLRARRVANAAEQLSGTGAGYTVRPPSGKPSGPGPARPTGPAPQGAGGYHQQSWPEAAPEPQPETPAQPKYWTGNPPRQGPSGPTRPVAPLGHGLHWTSPEPPAEAALPNWTHQAPPAGPIGPPSIAPTGSGTYYRQTWPAAPVETPAAAPAAATPAPAAAPTAPTVETPAAAPAAPAPRVMKLEDLPEPDKPGRYLVKENGDQKSRAELNQEFKDYGAEMKARRYAYGLYQDALQNNSPWSSENIDQIKPEDWPTVRQHLVDKGFLGENEKTPDTSAPLISKYLTVLESGVSPLDAKTPPPGDNMQQGGLVAPPPDHRIAQALAGQGFDSDEASQLPLEHWATLARAAGVNRPGQYSIQGVLRRLGKRAAPAQAAPYQSSPEVDRLLRQAFDRQRILQSLGA
jgi:hypothetical protein